GILLACSRLASVPGAPNPTLPPRAEERNLDQWFKDHVDTWLARVSGGVTIVGVVFAVVALVVARQNLSVAQRQLDTIRTDQERIASELSRRPDLEILFAFPSPDVQKRLRYGARSASEAQNPILLPLMIANQGQKTAHNVEVIVYRPAG